MSTISLGPFMIRADILMFLLSAIAGYLVLKWRLRGREDSGWIFDTYINALIIGFIAWKFGMVVFDPVRTFQNPMSLLYFTGGDKGVLLGAALALAYVGFKLNRNRERTVPLIRAAALGFMTGGVVWHVFALVVSDSLELPALMQAVLFGIFSVWLWKQYDSDVRSLLSIALWFSIGSVMIPFFEEDRNAVFAGFTSLQLAYAVLALILLVLEFFVLPHNRKTTDKL